MSDQCHRTMGKNSISEKEPQQQPRAISVKLASLLCGALCSVSITLATPDALTGIPLDDEDAKKAIATVDEKAIAEDLYNDLMDTVRGLNNPVKWEDAIKIPVKVTTKSKEARYFTRQGFGLLQNMWDIEAHRSFVYALKHDRKCIGAYTGLLMMSKQRHNPSHPQQKSLVSVVTTLKNKRVNGAYVYTEQERLYAEIALAMSDGDNDALSENVNALVKAYPMDFQALIMKHLVLPIRSGVSSLEAKSQFIGRMMKRDPMVPMLWSYWLTVHQFQNDAKFVKNELVPYSAKLVKWAPDMPVWHLYHGMYLHKAEMYDEADKSFDKAIELYTKWGRESNVIQDVNAPLWQALIYKSVNLYKAGKFDVAMKLAKELQQTEVKLNLRSEVCGLYLWEVQSLPARLYLARGKPGDFIRARESLPSKELLKSVEDITAAPMYFAALNEFIAFRIALKDGKIVSAKDIKYDYLDKSRQNFDITRGKPNNFIDIHYFHRGRYAVYAYQNYANAELEKINKNIKGFETFRAYMDENLLKGDRMLILPRHVIEDL